MIFLILALLLHNNKAKLTKKKKMSITKDKIMDAYKRTSHSNKRVVLSDAEIRVLRLLGLVELTPEEKRRIIKEKLNQAWVTTKH